MKCDLFCSFTVKDLEDGIFKTYFVVILHYQMVGCDTHHKSSPADTLTTILDVIEQPIQPQVIK